MAIGLPEGFELDQPSQQNIPQANGLPEGFELDNSTPNQPQMSRSEAAMTTMTNPLGFGDEIKAGLAASVAKVFGGAATKDIDIGDLYKEARDNERNKLAQAREQYPVQSFAGQMFSDIGVAGKLLKGAGLTGEGFKSAVKGGTALGGSSALGETQDITNLPQTAKDVGTGLAVGGITGGMVNKAVPPIIAGAQKVAGAPKALLQKIAGITPKSRETLKAFEDAGISPTLANISQGQTSKTFQNLVANFPGGRGVIEKSAQNQVDDIAKQLAGITRSEGGTIEETGETIKQGASNVKQLLEERITKNYDNLDKFVLSESQKAANPKLNEAIKEWESLNTLMNTLEGDVKLNTQRAGLINKNASIIRDPAKKLEYYNTLGFEEAKTPEVINALKELDSLKSLEEELIGSVQGNTKAAALIKGDASNKLGFFRTRGYKDSDEFLSKAIPEARNLENVRKQISNQKNIVKDLESGIRNKYLNAAVSDAKNLNNLNKQLVSNEKTIKGFEKYMSPEQIQSSLMSGQQKISTKNLNALVKDSQIQDIAAVGAGDTARVMNRYTQIVDEAGEVSYPRLKSFRSTIGVKLQSASLMGDERAALKRIYGALSEDMKSAIQANGGEKGLQAFNKANNAFNRYQDILESKINPLIEAKTPAAVYSMAMSGSKQGGTNIRGVMRTLDPQQKEFIRGTVVNQMGLATSGAQDATGAIFSPAKFLTEWSKIDNKLNREAAENLFTRPQIESIHNLNKAIDSLKKVSKAGQSSNNLPYLPYAAWAGLGGLTVANPLAAAAAVGGANITAKMMTNPRFINWLASTPKIKPTQIPTHLNQLSALAAANPDIREDVLDYIHSITVSDASADEPNMSEDQIRQQLEQQRQQYPMLSRDENLAEEAKIIKKRYYRD